MGHRERETDRENGLYGSKKQGKYHGAMSSKQTNGQK